MIRLKHKQLQIIKSFWSKYCTITFQ